MSLRYRWHNPLNDFDRTFNRTWGRFLLAGIAALFLSAGILGTGSAQITALSEPLSAEARKALEQAQASARQALKTYDAPYPDQPLYRESLRLGREAVRLAPENPEALRFLAELYGVTGFYGPAFGTWERFDSVGGVLDERARDQLERAGTQVGYARYEQGDLEGALSAYRRVTESAPERPLAHRWVGRILLELDSAQGALGAWRRVLELRPNDEGARYFAELSETGARYVLDAARAFYEGVSHFEAGRVERAQAQFTKATTLSPDYAEAWGYLGRTAFERESFASAEAAYREASALEPVNEAYRYFLGEAEREQKRSDEQ